MTEDGMVGSLNMTLKGLVAVVFIGVRAREHLSLALTTPPAD
jgi:hypothetical protein